MSEIPTGLEAMRTMRSERSDPKWLLEDERAAHPFSSSCKGETCSVCGKPAAHKLGQEFLWGENSSVHNLTAYVCCEHFCMVLGERACGLFQQALELPRGII